MPCHRAVGCAVCGNTGDRGRTGIYEVMAMTQELREALLRDAPREELFHLTTGTRTLAAKPCAKWRKA